MRRRTLILSSCACAGFGALTAYYWLAVAPWSAPPDERDAEIDARWSGVVAWSAVNAGWKGPFQDALIVQAAAHAQAAWASHPDLATTLATGLEKPLHPSAVPDEMRTALNELVAWNGQEGGLGATACLDNWDDRRLQGLALLAQMALAVAEDAPDDPHLDALLHLGRELRLHGRLRHAVAGGAIVDRSVEWAAMRVLVPLSPFERYPFTAEEIGRALARECICAYREAETLGLERLGDAWREAQAGRTPPEGAIDVGASHLQLTTTTRELLMARQHFGRVLAETRQHEAEIDWLAAHADFSRPGPGRDELPKSFLVRLLAHDQSVPLSRLAASFSRYRALRASGDSLAMVRELTAGIERWAAEAGSFPGGLDELTRIGIGPERLAAAAALGVTYESHGTEALLRVAGSSDGARRLVVMGGAGDANAGGEDGGDGSASAKRGADGDAATDAAAGAAVETERHGNGLPFSLKLRLIEDRAGPPPAPASGVMPVAAPGAALRPRALAPAAAAAAPAPPRRAPPPAAEARP